MDLNEKRVGEVLLSRALIMDISREDYAELMKDLFIMEAQYHWWLRSWRYIAICDQFDELAEGEAPPRYLYNVETERWERA